MQIIHIIDDFLFDLFPKAKNAKDIDILKQEIEEYYTYGPFRPKVKTEQNFLIIEIDTPSIANQEKDYKKVVSLCEKGDFNSAKPILSKLIKDNPTNSEYYRILGQINSEEGDQESALNHLIDSLKWYPKNNFALLMIGNIFAKYKNDLSTAKKYYNKVIENDPKDFIAINNLATNIIQAGNIEEGLEYYEKAYSVNKDYPNTVYGIALSNEMLGNNLIAFEFGVECLKKCTNKDGVIRKHATDLVFKNAHKYLEVYSGEKVFLEYKDYVERLCRKPIKVEADTTIDTAAKIEYAEKYDRDYHLVKYKPSYIGVYHLIAHEIAHLHLATEARNENANMLFVTTNEQLKLFRVNFQKYADNLRKSGIPDASVENYFNAIFYGLNSQLFNAPIDLFIEDRLYELYQELRPIQFLSMFQMATEGVKAVTDKTATKYAPPAIHFVSKVLNIVNALHLKDLFGIDILSDFNASNNELKQAKDFYQEFFEYRDDKKPGEEYEIVRHWGDDLKFGQYFTLKKESSFDGPNTIESIINKLEEDPFSLNSEEEFKKEQMDQFFNSQKEIGTNMAVVMFMVDAMQFFQKMSKEQIKEIAFQIAMIGTQGIKPEKQDYIIPSIKNKKFSGYHLLAYYYISWKLAIPDMLASLQLPYDNEYQLAIQMFKH